MRVRHLNITPRHQMADSQLLSQVAIVTLVPKVQYLPIIAPTSRRWRRRTLKRLVYGILQRCLS
jgi:hypothetical protein